MLDAVFAALVILEQILDDLGHVVPAAKLSAGFLWA
jgi:hypothetical protein